MGKVLQPWVIRKRKQMSNKCDPYKVGDEARIKLSTTGCGKLGGSNMAPLDSDSINCQLTDGLKNEIDIKWNNECSKFLLPHL